MRTWGGVVLAVVLAACGGGGGEPEASAPPSTPAPATSSAPDPARVAEADAVRAAVRATRAKATATFAMEATTVLRGGHVSILREGRYDARNGTADVTQSMESEPASLMEQFTGEKDLDLDRYVMRGVRAGGALYVQMPRIKQFWIRFTSDANAAAQGFDVEAEPFPRMLAMLERATPSTAPRMGPIHYVDVPAPLAMRAVPGSTTTAALTKAGVDVDAIPGTVQVSVEVVNGVVTKVTFDAIEAFKEAWTRAGMSQLGTAVTSVETTMTLTGHGRPATIAVPKGEVMTEDDLKAAG